MYMSSALRGYYAKTKLRGCMSIRIIGRGVRVRLFPRGARPYMVPVRLSSSLLSLSISPTGSNVERDFVTAHAEDRGSGG